MPFSDLFGTGEHQRNLGHFAAIVNLATVDGEINAREEAQLKRFAAKLDVSEEEYNRILENPNAYPIHPNNSREGRLEKIHDLLKIIFADSQLDKGEAELLKKYAIAIGFSSQEAEKIVKKSIQIFSGQIDFEDYVYLLNKEKK